MVWRSYPVWTCAAVNVEEGNLQNMRRDVMQVVVEERAPTLTTTVATFAASWRFSNCTIKAGNHRNKGPIKTKIVEIEMKVFLEFLLPATMASDSANHARATLASSLVVRRVT